MNWKLGTPLGASCHFAAFCLKYRSPLELGSDRVKHPLRVLALKRRCQERSWGLQRGPTFYIPSTLNLESSLVSLFSLQTFILSTAQTKPHAVLSFLLSPLCPPTGCWLVTSWFCVEPSFLYSHWKILNFKRVWDTDNCLTSEEITYSHHASFSLWCLLYNQPHYQLTHQDTDTVTIVLAQWQAVLVFLAEQAELYRFYCIAY